MSKILFVVRFYGCLFVLLLCDVCEIDGFVMVEIFEDFVVDESLCLG